MSTRKVFGYTLLRVLHQSKGSGKFCHIPEEFSNIPRYFRDIPLFRGFATPSSNLMFILDTFKCFNDKTLFNLQSWRNVDATPELNT